MGGRDDEYPTSRPGDEDDDHVSRPAESQLARPLDPTTLPYKWEIYSKQKEWEVDPRYTTSTLDGLSKGGVPLVGPISGVIGLATADSTKDRIEAGVELAGEAVGLAEGAVGFFSSAPASGAAAFLGATGALLGAGMAWWKVFSGGGAAIDDGIKIAKREIEAPGFFQGAAAALLGYDDATVNRLTELPPGYQAGIGSGYRTQDEVKKSYYEKRAKGWQHFLPLSRSEAEVIVAAVDKYKAHLSRQTTGWTRRPVLYTFPQSDPKAERLSEVARLLPPMIDELRAGTFKIEEPDPESVETGSGKDVVGVVLAGGADVRQIAAEILERTWGHPPTEEQVQAYYESIIEANASALPPSSDPADVQEGTVITLPAVPQEFPTSTGHEKESAEGDLRPGANGAESDDHGAAPGTGQAGSPVTHNMEKEHADASVDMEAAAAQKEAASAAEKFDFAADNRGQVESQEQAPVPPPATTPTQEGQLPPPAAPTVTANPTDGQTVQAPPAATSPEAGAATDRDEDGVADELEEAEGVGTAQQGAQPVNTSEEDAAHEGAGGESTDAHDQGQPVEIDSDGDGELDMTQEAQPAALHQATSMSQETAGIDAGADHANEPLSQDGVDDADGVGTTPGNGAATVALGSSIDEQGGTGGFIETTGGGNLAPAHSGESATTAQPAPISDYDPNTAVMTLEDHLAPANGTGDYDPNDTAQQPDDHVLSQQPSGAPATDGQAEGASSESRSDYDPNGTATGQGNGSDYEPNAAATGQDKSSDYDPNESAEREAALESQPMENDGYEYDSSAEGSQVDSTGSDGGGGDSGGGSSEGAGSQQVVV